MNFNSFIKIKIINWKDNSKTSYLNGIVISKNIADRRMLNLIENPQILILKDSLCFDNDDKHYNHIGNVID